jgi:hypothetical protein
MFPLHHQHRADADESQIPPDLESINRFRGLDAESQIFSSETSGLLTIPCPFKDSAESDLDSGVEDGPVDKTRNARRKSLFSKYLPMAARSSRRSLDKRAGDNKDGLGNPPPLTCAFRVKRASKRSCYKWCIFGGISGAGLL